MTRRAFLLLTGLLTASWTWAGQVERLDETKEEAFRLLEDDKVRLAMIGVRRVTYATSLFNDLQGVLGGFASEIRESLPPDAVQNPSS